MNNNNIIIYFKETGKVTKVINEETGQECTFECVSEVDEDE